MENGHNLYAALSKLRSSTRGPGMAPALGDAFELLDTAGTFAWLDTWHEQNDWPKRPVVLRELGVQIRHRKIVGGVRLGGSEPGFIVAETREWIVYEIFDSKGGHLGENTIKRVDFDAKFERKE